MSEDEFCRMASSIVNGVAEGLLRTEECRASPTRAIAVSAALLAVAMSIQERAGGQSRATAWLYAAADYFPRRGSLSRFGWRPFDPTQHVARNPPPAAPLTVA